MRNLYLLIALFFIGIASQPVHAQNANWEINNFRKKSTSVPFRLISNLIVVKLSVNGSNPLNFIVDTGVKGTMITELSFGDSLTLISASERKLYGLGGTQEILALETTDNSIRLGKLKGKNQKIMVLMENVFQLSQKLGTKINGIIGYELFRDYIVEINYSHRVLRFHERKLFKKRSGKRYRDFPISWNGYKPYINLNVMVHNQSYPMHLLLDTGSSDAIWIFKESIDSLTIPNPNSHLYLGRGLGGDIFGHKARIKKVCFQDLCLQSPVASFPDSAELATAMNYKLRNGSIGGDILKRFNVFFDYKNSVLTLKKNSQFSSPFKFDLSGIDVTNPVLGLPVFYISNVRPDSPAFLAGLQPDDQIISLNRVIVSDYTLESIQAVLRRQHGSKVFITVLRDGKKIYTSFRLKDFL